ncbi:hypothetical protein FGO68_gene12853 [Halteria grandinella]|uniref:Uncharacterized protein n=1 Tax=Halteria grandinella TaxID=5974 RepID=A0A8J8NDG4_HALGN|nr:hypothetical protein FGO68_gene12853 [Halteria grandinella]
MIKMSYQYSFRLLEKQAVHVALDRSVKQRGIQCVEGCLDSRFAQSKADLRFHLIVINHGSAANIHQIEEVLQGLLRISKSISARRKLNKQRKAPFDIVLVIFFVFTLHCYINVVQVLLNLLNVIPRHQILVQSYLPVAIFSFHLIAKTSIEVLAPCPINTDHQLLDNLRPQIFDAIIPSTY